MDSDAYYWVDTVDLYPTSAAAFASTSENSPLGRRVAPIMIGLPKDHLKGNRGIFGCRPKLPINLGVNVKKYSENTLRRFADVVMATIEREGNSCKTNLEDPLD